MQDSSADTSIQSLSSLEEMINFKQHIITSLSWEAELYL